ncbi:beta-1,3-galactosyltransferase 1-like [Ostrea edulis]|uniref:beta-1,3-galactosyltransferase 1-like n=1 Tax=Ostrea edulis TaxID=37623 RepID=UPI0020945B13|nr:beta-1,3-galactosyltransferase 1-like [Ostrea edulis]
MTALRKTTIILSLRNLTYLLAALSVVVLFSIWNQNRQLSKFSDSLWRFKGNLFNIFYSTVLFNTNNSSIIDFQSNGDKQTAFLSIEDHARITNESHTAARPLLCTSCFLHNYGYVLNNDGICDLKNSVDSIRIIILIFSTHANTDRRKALRESWLLPYRHNQDNIRYAFLLGMTSNPSLQGRLETESALYKDIVQENFLDSYHNLTIKTVMALKWVITHCNHAKFMMKTDDDMYVNTESLKIALQQHGIQLLRSVGGHCWLKGRPQRQRSSKWYASYRMYPQKIYPGFCSGTGYVTSISMAKKLFDVTPHVPFFHLEDVYVGLCLYALGLSVTHIRGFNLGRIPLGCVYKSNTLITSHELELHHLLYVWHLKCKKKHTG